MVYITSTLLPKKRQVVAAAPEKATAPLHEVVSVKMFMIDQVVVVSSSSCSLSVCLSLSFTLSLSLICFSLSLIVLSKEVKTQTTCNMCRLKTLERLSTTYSDCEVDIILEAWGQVYDRARLANKQAEYDAEIPRRAHKIGLTPERQ